MTSLRRPPCGQILGEPRHVGPVLGQTRCSFAHVLRDAVRDLILHRFRRSRRGSQGGGGGIQVRAGDRANDPRRGHLPPGTGVASEARAEEPLPAGRRPDQSGAQPGAGFGSTVRCRADQIRRRERDDAVSCQSRARDVALEMSGTIQEGHVLGDVLVLQRALQRRKERRRSAATASSAAVCATAWSASRRRSRVSVNSQAGPGARLTTRIRGESQYS